jgi:hypothetical protein
VCVDRLSLPIITNLFGTLSHGVEKLDLKRLCCMCRVVQLKRRRTKGHGCR